jgi:cytochrome c peroxidase
MRLGAVIWALFSCGLLACEPEAPYEWQLPPGFPIPPTPEDNPMSAAKVELGRLLFYDVRSSENGTQSCASCHRQALAFTDGRTNAIGSTGEMHPRGSMSLANVAYVQRLTWADPDLDRLEDQSSIPLFGEMPIELGAREDELVARVRDDAEYPALFARAFPHERDPISVTNIARALASFERTLISGGSVYDRWVHGGDATAMSGAALRGSQLFHSDRLECFHCHEDLDDPGIVHVVFLNNALYNLGGQGAYPEPNRGIYEHTFDPRDMGHFRAPSLRNIALTAPYMHDGSIATLDEVLDHYAAGGRTIEDGPYAGVGSLSPIKSHFVHGFTLSADERADLHAFFDSLTDADFVSDPRFADPFAPP